MLTNAVSVLLDATTGHDWKIVLDDMHYASNIESTTSNTSSNHDWEVTLAKGTNSSLALTLAALRVDGGDRKLLIVEPIIKLITGAASVDKDKSAAWRDTTHQIDESLPLLAAFDPDDVLLDIRMGRAGASDSDAAVVETHVSVGNFASRRWEGSGEHQHADVTLVLG